MFVYICLVALLTWHLCHTATIDLWTGCFLLPFYLELKHVSDRLSASGGDGSWAKENEKRVV